MATDDNDSAPGFMLRSTVWLVMTLDPWLAAFVTVTALLSALGPQLASLPLAARALVISGVGVTVMTRLALPG